MKYEPNVVASWVGIQEAELECGQLTKDECLSVSVIFTALGITTIWLVVASWYGFSPQIVGGAAFIWLLLAGSAAFAGREVYKNHQRKRVATARKFQVDNESANWAQPKMIPIQVDGGIQLVPEGAITRCRFTDLRVAELEIGGYCDDLHVTLHLPRLTMSATVGNNVMRLLLASAIGRRDQSQTRVVVEDIAAILDELRAAAAVLIQPPPAAPPAAAP